MKNENHAKRKISKRFIVYVIVTLIIVYIFIFVLGSVYKINILTILMASIPIGIIWIIYSLITLKPYVYEKNTSDEKENKNDEF